jgi:hypothetical protein
MEENLIRTFAAARDDGTIVVINEWQGYHPRVAEGRPGSSGQWVADGVTRLCTESGSPVRTYGHVDGHFLIPSTSEQLILVGSPEMRRCQQARRYRLMALKHPLPAVAL